eukprot:evm.model.NODE_11366_length_1473_cov_12.607603.1
MKTLADTTRDIGPEEEEEEDEDDDVEEEEEEEGKEVTGSAKKKGNKSKKGKGKKRASTEPALKVSEFAGIQIQVSFTGTGDRHLMQQVRPSPSWPLALSPSLTFFLSTLGKDSSGTG